MRTLHVDVYIDVKSIEEVAGAVKALSEHMGASDWALGDFIVKEGRP